MMTRKALIDRKKKLKGDRNHIITLWSPHSVERGHYGIKGVRRSPATKAGLYTESLRSCLRNPPCTNLLHFTGVDSQRAKIEWDSVKLFLVMQLAPTIILAIVQRWSPSPNVRRHCQRNTIASDDNTSKYEWERGKGWCYQVPQVCSDLCFRMWCFGPKIYNLL